MPRPVPAPIRKVIYRRVEHGDEASVIAEELQLPVRTVRHLVQRFRARGGAVQPDYTHCGRPLPQSSPPPMFAEARALREQHPGWGAGLIRVILKDTHPHTAIPSERTLRRWLSRGGAPPAPPGRRPATKADRAAQPHEVWQIDAADQKRLKSGSMISWLRMADECSGAVLKTVVFSRRKLQSGAPHRHSASAARTVSPLGATGTRARGQRVALGVVGRSGDLPPDLALWLVGLGVDIHWNHPGRPQENGVIERSQGTAKRWADPQACDSVQELQRNLDRMDEIQRERYPIPGHASRREAWPQLKHSGRNYSLAWERSHWSLQRVLEHLSLYAVTRRVSNNGRISLYNRTRYVGLIHQGKTIYVMLDPQEIAWIVTDQQGRQLRHLPAPELTPSTIIQLEVARHEKRKQTNTRGKTLMAGLTAKLHGR